MKIAVIGCGAMGSIYAAKLAAAGHNVLVVDRHQAGVEAISRHGLRVTGPGSDHTVALRAVRTAPAEPMDLVVLAVKAADVTTGAEQAFAARRANHGVDHPEWARLGRHRCRHRR